MNDPRSFRAMSQGPRTTDKPSNQASFDKQKNSRTEPRVSAPSSAPESLESKKAPLRNFRDLKVWQMAKEIAVGTYRVTQLFPREEIYGLSSQMRQAAISIASNIAEGFNRFYKKDYRRFLMISLGACGELESQIEVGAALGYVPENALTGLLEKLAHESRMLRKLHSAMDEKRRPEDSSPDFTAQKNSPAPKAPSDPFGY